jgi:adenosine deaminase
MKLKITNFVWVIIDNNLSWEVHIERTYSRISRNLFLINRVSKVLDLHEKRMCYCSISPILSFGIVWGQCQGIHQTNNTRNDDCINVFDLEDE